MNRDIKQSISDSILKFNSGELFENSIGLFNALGYNTSRQSQFEDNSYKSFAHNYVDSERSFNEDKALIAEWDKIELLFQLSDDEITDQNDIFSTDKLDPNIYKSYLFFAIELSVENYTRTQLSQITRELNKLFDMPVLVLFKYNSKLTLSVINRRLHKRDSSKDVLEKVTLIKDIDIISPHRAHIEILFDLSAEELFRKHTVSDFEGLHNAWKINLDTKELNKKFFKELSSWYFWAIDKTVWPDDIEKKKDVRNATNVIRLITRLMFVWFLKEKGLVPEKLFDRGELKKALKYSDDKKSTYYKAILQNLFFATLNTEMDKRKFRTKRDGGRDSHYFIHNLFRYEKEFVNPQKTLKECFLPIPFLNGGLFECLDKDIVEGKKHKKIRVDGFSDHNNNCLKVPDILFFSEAEKEIDLNAIYGTINKRYKVRGLINILSSYKFTIAENTPLEEEIALDPELLGKVFENLLANYNPETQTTARKQTGSFYTPREIVNYMVDQSLIVYLKNKVIEGAKSYVKLGDEQTDLLGNTARVGQLKLEEELLPSRWLNKEEELEKALRDLISYSEEKHPFSDTEVDLLIKSIDNCKILDPACGSGAFPMGVLHKMVHALHKLDPENQKWEQKQLDKIDKLLEDADLISDTKTREDVIEGLGKNKKDVEEAFANNELDFGRKLYLIENCIYGVDIQPIAVQIAKLRFFISLIVDQIINKKKDNSGVRPLPNLETKIVSANTLIELEKPEQMSFRNSKIDELEREMKEVRRKHFEARTPKTKERYRRKDRSIREELAELLEKDGFNPEEVKKLAKWNPYDQNTHAEFFDYEWMFGLSNGFDIVIGNPPYINAKLLKANYEDLRSKLNRSKNYKTLYQKWDLYVPFIERGLELLSPNGISTMIIPFPFVNQLYSKILRRHIIENYNLFELVDLSDTKVFDATVLNCIYFVSNQKPQSHLTISKSIDHSICKVAKLAKKDLIIDDETYVWELSKKNFINFNNDKLLFATLGDFVFISVGMVLNADEKVAKGLFKKEELISKTRTRVHKKKYIEAKNISKYRILKYNWLEWNTERVPKLIRRKTFPELYVNPKILVNKIGAMKACYDSDNFHCDQTIRILILWHNLKGVKNRSISNSIVKFYKKPRKVLEDKSKNITYNYLLAILNSKMGLFLLNSIRGTGNIDINPEYLKKILIPNPKSESLPIIEDIVNVLIIAINLSNEKISLYFEALVDAFVYELYFPQKFIITKCEVLKHLDNIPVLKEEWSNEKKLEIIEKVYHELSDPKHPVSIAIEKMKEVEEIKIIERRK